MDTRTRHAYAPRHPLGALVAGLVAALSTLCLGIGVAHAQIDWDPDGGGGGTDTGSDTTDGDGGSDSSDKPRRKRCREGMERSTDTGGECCYPGQAHNGARCVGLPSQCPAGWFADDKLQTCLPASCVDGRVLLADGEHCCWPGQAWSGTQGMCVGTPNCPPGYELGGSPAGCVAVPDDDDTDGLANDVDQCPMEAEDRDGFMDDDGCPDYDNDGDRINDIADRCPLQAEDPDRFEDMDGCPDLDNDGDRVPDELDMCIVEAEDFDGFEDDDGCPERDNDRDRIADESDLCPNEPETYNEFEDYDGCPDGEASTASAMSIAGWSLMGGGVAMVGTSVALAFLAASERETFGDPIEVTDVPGLEDRTFYDADLDASVEAEDAATSMETAAIVVGSIGGAAVISGVVLLVLAANAETSPAQSAPTGQLRPELIVTPDGARAGLEVTF